MTGIAAVVSAVLTAMILVTALRQRRRKSIVYTIEKQEVDLRPSVCRSWIQLRAGERALVHPHAVTFTMRNDGNEPIRVEDFDGAVHVELSEAEVIDWETRPIGQKLKVAVTDLPGEGLAIEPLLLNPGDGFVLTALLDRRPRDVDVHAHIAAQVADEAVLAALGTGRPRGLVGFLAVALRLVSGERLSLARRHRQPRRYGGLDPER